MDIVVDGGAQGTRQADTTQQEPQEGQKATDYVISMPTAGPMLTVD